jgi:hypothetical protein
MNRRFAGAMMAVALLLGGCATAPQMPVSLAGDYFAGPAKTGRVGVAMAELPKPDTEFPGAGCLLCIAVASGAHSALTTQVRTLTTDELKPLKADLVALLKKRGLDAVVIDEPIKVKDLPDFKAAEPANFSRKDFSALKTRHQIDRLMVVDIGSLGVWRSYSAYVPTDVPRAVVNGSAYLLDLATHRYEWLHPIAVKRAAEGAWDEPPKFPGLSNAYYQALETAMDEIKKPFAK